MSMIVARIMLLQKRMMCNLKGKVYRKSKKKGELMFVSLHYLCVPYYLNRLIFCIHPFLGKLWKESLINILLCMDHQVPTNSYVVWKVDYTHKSIFFVSCVHHLCQFLYFYCQNLSKRFDLYFKSALKIGKVDLKPVNICTKEHINSLIVQLFVSLDSPNITKISNNYFD